MTRPSESGELTNEESADLTERVERFRAAWSPDGSTDLARALPSPGARHRRAVLVQIALTDMERRASVHLAFRVERYIDLFPDELSTATVPAALLVAEYRLRHQYTDRPELAEYQRWFPAQFEAMAKALPGEPLVRSEERTARTTVRPAVPGASTLGQSRRRPDPPPAIAAGEVLPSDTPYRLVRKLGAGAFGEVFEARAPGEIPVAVKRIMRSVDHPSSVSERDALEAIKRLSHPFLLKTNAYWILDDRLVIVMELADTSLADRIVFHQNQGRPGVPPEELIPLFEQAAKALDYLHSENVSHRDIKPENILILKGYAKVADFGLARPQEHTLTVVGSTVGTPAYMAPEMWRQQVSLQSDQYSLAATYVRARLGRALFQTTILVDMGNSHLRETPDLDPLPTAEQRVLLKALAKNPDDRFASCLEFAEALHDAVFPPAEQQTHRPGLRLAIAAGAAVAVVAVAVGLVLFPPWGDQTKEQPDKSPEKGTANAEPSQKELVTITGWAADPAEPLTIGEKRYPLKLTRKVDEETLVAILIYKTNSDDPSPFYMLENKVTNRVFARLWKEIEDDMSSELYNLGPARGALAPKKWERGAPDYEKDPDDPKRWLGITGEQADVPVLGVTVPQAILVAKKLGGALPGRHQWLKATGALEPSKPPPVKDPLPRNLGEAAKRKYFEDRDLALGRYRPLSVTKGSGDESFWKIRQLVTNGPEWLGQSNPADDTSRILLTEHDDQALAVYVGRGYNELDVLDFAAIRQRPAVDAMTKVEGLYAGFRIVLTP